jgi:type I restriction enzyme M protein
MPTNRVPQTMRSPDERLMSTYLDRAFADGHASLAPSGSKTRITYLAVNRSEIFDDPEEKVRGEYWAELIYRYGYRPERIGIEIIVPDRTPSDAADLVVFRDDERTRPFAVIECKRDGISDAEFSQAVEQAAGNGTWAKLRAPYVGVVAGLTRRFLDFGGDFGALEREKNVIADLPAEYGEPEEFKYRKGGVVDIEPVSRETLIQAIRKSHQTLWSGGRLSPPQAFGELCKLIFVKIADEQAKRRVGQPYQFQIKTHETSKHLAGRIRDLYSAHQKRDPTVFTDTIRIGDETLRAIVSHLEPINLSATDLDVKGVAFEQFMDGFFKGDFGQYFTPRPIIEFAVAMLAPTSDDRVLDPASGSGGFLLYVLDAVRREAAEYHPDVESAEHYKHWHDFAENELFGIEINDEICRVAKMNMIIHDDGHSNIVGDDALQPIAKLTGRNKGLTSGGFDLVLTNPPFGASVEFNAHPYLTDYDLGMTKPDRNGKRKVRKSQKTEILFIERIWDFLKPNGRAAVVLPDGVLNNPSNAYVREFVMAYFQVLAVVSLPATAFAHYGAGVKASVVFLRKRAYGETPSDQEITFMAAPEKIGYDATGRETTNELPTLVNAYQKFVHDPKPFLT